MEQIRRLVRVDQKPIGRTPRSNLATYTGLFDHVRKLFAATKARAAAATTRAAFRSTSRKGRCENCEGEGFVMVELLFLPSVYAPCPSVMVRATTRRRSRFTYRDKNIAEVLGMTVDAALRVLRRDEPALRCACACCGKWARLSPARPACHRTIGRRSAADQAGDGTAANAARRHALHARRTDDRPASRRRREADDPAARPGRCRQYRDRRRARYARRGAAAIG